MRVWACAGQPRSLTICASFKEATPSLTLTLKTSASVASSVSSSSRERHIYGWCKCELGRRLLQTHKLASLELPLELSKVLSMATLWGQRRPASGQWGPANDQRHQAPRGKCSVRPLSPLEQQPLVPDGNWRPVCLVVWASSSRVERVLELAGACARYAESHSFARTNTLAQAARCGGEP